MTSALVLAGALLLARPGDAAAPRLLPVQNGDFEEAEAGANFPAGCWTNKNKGDISLITNAMHGLKAVQVKAGWEWACTDLNIPFGSANGNMLLPEGEEISIGWWVKLDDVKKGWNDSDICRLYVKFKTNAWVESTVELARFEGTAGWKWMTKKKILVPANLKEATIVLTFDGASRGALSLDRIVVAKGTDLPPETITTADEIALATDQARAAIGRARAAAQRDTVEGSAGEALSDVRGRVDAVTLLANELEAEAKALAAKAEPRSNLLERAADAERSVAVVRTKIAAAIALIAEGEAAQKREPTRAKAEEVSSAKAAEALAILREAVAAADLAANAMTASMILAGTWGGGVWRITDENKWVAANVDAPRPYTAFLTAAPDGRLYCAGVEATLLDSDDNGKTWSATPTRLPAPATGFALNPGDPTHWLITTWGRGVWTSADEGRNWTEAPAPSKFMRSGRILRATPTSPARVYAVADGTTIVRAETFGGEWKEIARMPRGIAAWDVAMKPTKQPVLLAATDAGVAEIGDDGKVAFPRLEASSAWARAIVTDLDRVLIGTYGGGIVEWRPVTTETPKSRRINGDLGNQVVTAMAGSLHPKPEVTGEADIVVGPRIWSDRSTGLAGAKINGITFNPRDEKVMYCSTKSGLYRSNDAGANWFLSSTGLKALNLGRIIVDPNTPENIYVAAAFLNNPAGIQKSTDAAKNWLQKNKGLTALAALWLALNQSSPANLIAVTWGSGSFITWDGAETWYSIAGPTQQNGYCAAFGAANSSDVLLGMAGQVYKLADSKGSKVWVASGKGIPGLDIWSLAQDPRDAKVWLAGTAGGGLYKSTDGAASWRRVNKGLTSMDIYRIVYHPAKPGVVFIGTKNSNTGRGGDGVFRSVDGGESWATDNEGLSSYGIEDLAVTSKGLVYLATQTGVFYKQE
ncbi:MAG: hypothetical protein AAB152_15130 [Candidatus Coatesbacteria bacterium]